MSHTEEIKQRVKELIGKQNSQKDIAKILGVSVRTIRTWTKDWNAAAAGPKQKPDKPVKTNDISKMNLELLGINRPYFHPFQEKRLKSEAALRWDMKSRQIGMTFTYAWEALCNALQEGVSSVVCATRLETTFQFRKYMLEHAEKALGIKLNHTTKPYEIAFTNGGQSHAIVTFLPNNPAGTRSLDDANVYLDEACYLKNYEAINEGLVAIATLNDRRVTKISSPGIKGNPGYEEYCQLLKKPKSKYVETFETTIHDAVADGFPADIDKLRAVSITPALFSCYYECKPMAPEDALFTEQDLARCLYDPEEIRASCPGSPILMALDPSVVQDYSCFVVARWNQKTGHLYILDIVKNKGSSIEENLAQFKKLVNQWGFPQFLAMDNTGIGQPYAASFINLYPHIVRRVNYNINNKGQMVAEMLNTVRSQTIHLPNNDPALIQSFQSVHLGGTSAGQITVKSRRSKEIGHGDDFWSIAMICHEVNKIVPVVNQSGSICTLISGKPQHNDSAYGESDNNSMMSDIHWGLDDDSDFKTMNEMY